MFVNVLTVLSKSKKEKRESVGKQARKVAFFDNVTKMSLPTD